MEKFGEIIDLQETNRKIKLLNLGISFLIFVCNLLRGLLGHNNMDIFSWFVDMISKNESTIQIQATRVYFLQKMVFVKIL
jgi:hypothetical protein